MGAAALLSAPILTTAASIWVTAAIGLLTGGELLDRRGRGVTILVLLAILAHRSY